MASTRRTKRKARAKSARGPSRRSNASKRPKARAAKPVARGTKGGRAGSVDAYVAAVSPAIRPIVERLRALVRAALPGADEALKWGQPVYAQHGLVCYLRAFGGHAVLGFFAQGTRIDDPKGLLEGSGKGMRHIKVPSLEAIDEPLFTRMVQQAAALNAA